MIIYLLKFVACSGLLLAAYHLFLANERLYQFNRFYLLFSLAFALVIPLVTLKIAPATLPAFEQQDLNKTVLATADRPENIQNKPEGNQTEEVVVQPAVSTVTQATLTKVNRQVYHQTFIERLCAIAPVALLCVYIAGLLIMLFRFVGNGYRIGRRIRGSVVEFVGHVKLVLLTGQVTPHSFFNYVFLNKAEYDNGLIGSEIICHEQAHVRQWHSLDVLFVELVQALCWFNPFIPLYRRAIQLNHEFLADETVIKNYNNTLAYQQLLLKCISKQSGLHLTSQLNYSITKKRFMMMTKRTSTKMALLKQLAIAPVIAGAVLLFSQKVMAQIQPASVVPDTKMAAPKQDSTQSIVEEYTAILKKYNLPPPALPNGKHKALLNSTFSKPDHQRLQALYNSMTKAQQNQQVVRFKPLLKPDAKKSPTAAQLLEWQDGVRYGVWVDDKRIKNSELAKYKPSDFDCYLFSRLTKIAIANDKFHFQVNLMTPANYVKYCKEINDWHFQPVYLVFPNAHVTASKSAAPAKVYTPQSVINEYVAQQHLTPAQLSWLAKLKKKQQAFLKTEEGKKYEGQTKAYLAYLDTDEGKKKKAFADAIRWTTVAIKITGQYRDPKGKVIGILAQYNGQKLLMLSCYGQVKRLNNLLKTGDEVSISVWNSGVAYQQDIPVHVVPAYILKNNQKIFQLAEADKLPDYPFLVEGNTVLHAEGQVTNIVKYADGKWKTALLETVNGYKFNLSFKPGAPDMKSIEDGDHIGLRFVNGVKAHGSVFNVNDWVSIATYQQVYKNPALYNKYYSNKQPHAIEGTKSHS